MDDSFASAVLPEIVKSCALPPSPERMGCLLTFIGLQAVRTARFRRNQERFSDEMKRIMVDIITLNDDRFSAAIKRYERDVGPLPSKIDREELRVSATTGRMPRDRNVMMRIMLHACLAASETMYARRWQLLVATDEAPDFVTSDSPVTVMPMKGSAMPIGPTGFGLPTTRVVYPLTRRMAMLGTFGPQPPSPRIVNREMVAAINTITILGAYRFIYSRRRRVHYARRGELRTDLHAFRLSEVVGPEAKTDEPRA